MKIHFIAIGGSVMHNMALAMQNSGNSVSGSDDEIFEPAKSRLLAKGILPEQTGWFPEKIHADMDAVILGMHAREDNPELMRAKELNLKIYSFPEYIYEQSRNKTRVVIGGSHGKTTITAMVMHVMHTLEYDFDYMVGAQLEGFETMFRISDAPVIILEGDEYLTSTLDRRPKFHLYRPNIALLTGIAWDHINVFPTFENYVEQFRKFVELIEPNGSIIYYEPDTVLKDICRSAHYSIKKFPYTTFDYEINDGVTTALFGRIVAELQIFGKHNMANLSGARLLCKHLGIATSEFLEAMKTFKGAAKRLELVGKNADAAFYKDFAHSPSKLKATLDAVSEQFPERKLVACMELHTYSSLNNDFLKEYHNAMNQADIAIVYYSAHALEIKKMPPLSPEMIKQSFGRNNLKIFTDREQLTAFLQTQTWKNRNLLMMSSGGYDGLDFIGLSKQLGIS
jgi:UDP-N-acetylmuramate: L-alanyl-gamma-D-glutamyl-meso-diaminopimelate ligase